MRKVLGAIAGVGLTASAASLMAASLLPDQAPAQADVDDVGARVVLERLPDGSDVILRRLPDEDGTSTMRVEEAPGEEAPGEEVPEPASPREWTTAPGDHLWHIAEATLTDSWGRAPTDAELAPYWEQVVEQNRALLSDPGNPDLIFPGQVFRLPAPPPVPAAPPGGVRDPVRPGPRPTRHRVGCGAGRPAPRPGLSARRRRCRPRRRARPRRPRPGRGAPGW